MNIKYIHSLPYPSHGLPRQPPTPTGLLLNPWAFLLNPGAFLLHYTFLHYFFVFWRIFVRNRVWKRFFPTFDQFVVILGNARNGFGKIFSLTFRTFF